MTINALYWRASTETGEERQKGLQIIKYKGKTKEMCAIKMGNYTFLKTAMRGPD